MIRSLLAKEFRSLLPFVFLMGFLVLLDVVFISTTEFPDQYGLEKQFADGDTSIMLVVYFVLAFALAQGLLMRERVEDTLEFIDSLPASRTLVFACKWFSGFAVLISYPLISACLSFALHFISRTSSDPGLYSSFLARGTVIDLIMIGVFLSAGLALSFWGRFAFLAVALLAFAYAVIKDLQLPWVETIDPFAMATPVMMGNSLVVPWGSLCMQMGIGGACLAIAYVSFLNTGSTRRRGGAWKRLATPVLIFGSVIVATIWIVYAVVESDDGDYTEADVADNPVPVYAGWETSRAQTKSFEFIYPNNQASQAEALIDRAESIHGRVTDFFGESPKSGLVVDLTSNQPRHAGTAYWKRIRVNLLSASGSGAVPLEAVFGHELAHIYIDQLSENRIRDRFNSVRFFHEGLASYLEYRFFHPEEDLPEIRKVAAAAHARGDVRFEELVDNERLSADYAGDWVYPLGECFVAAVVERFGDEAPGELVRAFAREDAPDDLEAMTLWEDTFRAAGYDLEDAIAGFFELLDSETRKHRSFIDALPRLNAKIQRFGDRIGVSILSNETRPGPRRLICRFRPAVDSPDRHYSQGRADKDGIVWISASRFAEDSFWYQLGYRPGNTMMPIYEPWRRAPVPEEE